ncbi:helix-turn-helix domain-containing protein [Streptomyces sp. NPDC005811]|uniref:AraC-like ligand-binding domain-containing protein n=1 Tax=Streptomyces sp. NPDC005811 TaxID=3154565 RepID=UPI0033FD0288
MALILSTDSVPPRDRLAYWHEAVWKTFVPLDVTAPDAPADRPFCGSVITDRLGQLQISTVDADRERVRRSPSLIAESGQELMLLGLQARGTGVVVQDGRTALLHPGEFALYDTTRPYTLDFPDRFVTVVFQMPRHTLGLPDAELRRITGITIGPRQGLAALVVPFLSKLAAEVGTCRPEVGEMLARNVTDLLTTTVTEYLGQDARRTDAAQETLLLRIRAFIDARLADPALSAEEIAAAHHISLRHLQRLFQADGTTVAGWIRGRRLEECRRALGRPRRSRPTVAAVAQQWGFVSPAHFSRAFRAAYDMSPREWQALAEETAFLPPRPLPD